MRESKSQKFLIVVIHKGTLCISRESPRYTVKITKVLCIRSSLHSL